MPAPIQRILVIGGGSAGFLAALTFRTMLPQAQLTVVHSPGIPVIGVGESTTPATPVHLHETLGIDRSEFHREVRPSWKLGLKFEWGARGRPHFNYTFDRYLDKRLPGLSKWTAFYCLDAPRDASVFNSLMELGRSPMTQRGRRTALDPRAVYHLPNVRFIDYLRRKSTEAGAALLEDELTEVRRADDGGVRSVRFKSGRELEADLFIDCTGFRSLLLGGALAEPYRSYSRALFCDRSVIGSWQRGDEVLPYTTMTTMDHGWCWRIDFSDAVTRGYVYSSAFCSDEQAAAELCANNPELAEAELRTLRFPRGRYERFWVRNVAAIGNACGFVEPLEATSLHLIIEQLFNLAWGLADADARPSDELRGLLNERFASTWDDVRDFLALHYKYNEHADTPFWRHCRAETPLGAAAALVEHYARLGPSRLLGRLMPNASIFGYGGYMSMLLGLQVPTEANPRTNERERRIWREHQQSNRRSAQQTLPMRQALDRAHRGV